LERLIGTTSLIREITLVAVSAGISGALFFAAAALLRIREIRWLWDVIRQRLR
jgi:hypothetical protein